MGGTVPLCPLDMHPLGPPRHTCPPPLRARGRPLYIKLKYMFFSYQLTKSQFVHFMIISLILSCTLILFFFLFRGVLFKIHISLFKTNLEFLNLEAVLLKLLVLLILRPYHLNGMLFLTRFLMIENSCMFP